MSNQLSLSERVRANRAAGKAPPVDLRTRVFDDDGESQPAALQVPADLRERLRDPESVRLPVDRPGVTAQTQTARPTPRAAAPTVPAVFRKPEWELVPSKLLSTRFAGIYVSVEREGRRLNLSAEAYEAIGSPSHVLVLIDRDLHMVALKSADAGNADATAVRQPKPHGYAVLTFGGAVRRLGIDTTVARRYEARMDGGMLVADLSPEAGTDVVSTPYKRKQKGGEA